MFITQFLCKECIIPDLMATSKDEVLTILAQFAVRAIPGEWSGGREPDEKDIFDVLKEREQLGSTGIGGGVAIPHGKVRGLERLMVFFARSRQGVPFDALDQKAVYAIFLLLAPESASTIYLKILARISRILKDRTVYNALIRAEDTEGLKKIIEEADKALPLSI